MKNVTTVTNNARILATIFAAVLSLAAANASASDANNEAYDNVTVTADVSANSAKRLVRSYLHDRGFKYGIGPGAARVKSITRDADTWIVRINYSSGGFVMSEQATLYVNAKTAVLAEVAPAPQPQQVAAQ